MRSFEAVLPDITKIARARRCATNWLFPYSAFGLGDVSALCPRFGTRMSWWKGPSPAALAPLAAAPQARGRLSADARDELENSSLQAEQALSDHERTHLFNTVARFQVRENERLLAAHPARIAIHHSKGCADVGR
jgi:hypothetical protein